MDNSIRIGNYGYMGTQVHKIPQDIISSISVGVVEKVNSFFGKHKISRVGDELVSKTFENVRVNHRYKIMDQDNKMVLESLKRRTVEIISEDAIGYFAQEIAKGTQSIWNTVGSYKPDNYRAVNTKANLINPTMTDEHPRF